MSDIVERLKDAVKYGYMPRLMREVSDEAADEITALRKKVEALEGALQWIGEFEGDAPGDANTVVRTIAKFARQALQPNGAVISLLEAGCTIAETAAITGQSYRIVEKYATQIDQRRMGKAAILKLETKRGRGKDSA